MTYYESPLGWLAISSNGTAITSIGFVNKPSEQQQADEVTKTNEKKGKERVWDHTRGF